jgi:hypothetical protein
MGEKEKPHDSGLLVKVKADGTGVDFTVGSALPELIGRLLPARFRIRRAVDLAIGDRIVEKIREGASLDQSEAAFAAEVFSDSAKKFARLGQVVTRAAELSGEGYRSKLLEGATQTPVQNDDAEETKTSEDWVAKFREDASLVDDELVREIYARILAEESQQPNTFSLRTLAVLRYMDREVATAFGWLYQVSVNGEMVPDKLARVLDVAGLDHGTMLMLDDAGLVNLGTHSQYSFSGNHVFAFPGLGRLVTVTNCEGAPPVRRTSIRVHFLTPAGRQLARIAERRPADAIFEAMVVWIKSYFDESQIMICSAEIESPDWKRNLPITGLETIWDGPGH